MPVGTVVDVPAGLDACVGLFVYEGVGRSLVTSLKFRNRRAAVPWLALALERQLRAAMPDVLARAVVVGVPTSAGRRRARGFDQAELLGRAVARATGRPHRRLLVRGSGPPQTGHDRAERLTGPVLAARTRCPRPVILVDDVLTTGATLAAAARAVRAAGVPVVVGAVLSVTPLDAQVPGARGRQLQQATRALVGGPEHGKAMSASSPRVGRRPEG